MFRFYNFYNFILYLPDFIFKINIPFFISPAFAFRILKT